MFHGQIERELSDGEPWSVEQRCKLPTHLQLLVEQEQEKRDICELSNKQHDDETANKKSHRFWIIDLRCWLNIMSL